MTYVDQAHRLRYEMLKRDELKEKLLNMGYYKTPGPDSKQLYELSLQELEQIYENEIARNGAVS